MKNKSKQISKLSQVLLKLSREGRLKQLDKIIHAKHPLDIADMLYFLKLDEIIFIFQQIGWKEGIDIFSFLEFEIQIQILETIQQEEIQIILEALEDDDRNILLKAFDEQQINIWIDLLDSEIQKTTRDLLSYKEGTIASRMSMRVPLFRDYWTVGQGLEYLRHYSYRKSSEIREEEIPPVIFVIDRSIKLKGTVSIKKLISSPENVPLNSVLAENPIFAYRDDDLEESVEKFDRYDILVLPIVDTQNKFLGVLNYDDGLEIVLKESRDDMNALVGIKSSEYDSDYFKLSILSQIRRRFFWIIIGSFTGIITGYIISLNENVLLKMIVLSTYLPIITALGGNLGSQATSILIQSMTLGKITFHDILKVIMKEILVSLGIGLCVATIMLTWIFLTQRSLFWEIGKVVSLAIITQSCVAALLGGGIPLLVKELKLDPALVSSPLISGSVDILGTLLYFGIAGLLLF